MARFQAPDDLASHAGFFRLENAVCYGRLKRGLQVCSTPVDLHDMQSEIRRGMNGIELPFDPTEVVQNLHNERYMAGYDSQERTIDSFIYKLYYLLRPALSVPVRKRLQKGWLSDWRSIRFPNWPVDTTVQSLMGTLCGLILRSGVVSQIPFIWFWPDGATACGIMTHDVETRQGRDFCEQLIQVNNGFDIKSSYQIIPEERYQVSTEFLNTIRSAGCEVNVHDLNHDGRLFIDRAEFLHRVSRINEYLADFDAKGFRSAVLYRNLEWYDGLHCSYDMSVPNVAHLGPQRGGCCTVMPYFVGNILELPVTTTEDYALFHILDDYSIDLWKKQISLICQNHGLASFLVHPDYLRSRKAYTTYVSLLEHLTQLRAGGEMWFTLPAEVDKWWRLRSQMTLSQHEGKWVVEGIGSDRACVAYASLEHDSVRYNIEP